jgi:DNA-binding LacI/PurR family transcriptional regulator
VDTTGDRTVARAPTLEDVAAAAGVSRSTASRAINSGAKVSADAQAAVDAAVLTLGFTPNHAARALVTARTNFLALVIPEPDDRVTGDPFFASVIRGLGQALDDTEFAMVLLLARRGDTADKTMRYLRHGHVDGAVVVSHHATDTIERALAASRLPAVFVGRPWHAPDAFSYVDTDNHHGAELATAHLVTGGRQRIGTVAGPADMIAAVDRLEGWSTALATAQLPRNAVEHGDFTTEGGAAAARRLLERNPDLDGIFVANDLMAVGVLDVLRSRGRSVPGDVAVVGYDNAALSAVSDPPLTTVVNPVADMARIAGTVLMGRVHGNPVGAPTIFPPSLVLRASA